MRTDMKTFHLRSSKNQESDAIRFKESGELDGTLTDGQGKKTDVVNILPVALREDLPWRAAGAWPYALFRDMLRSKAARSLMMQTRLLLLHNVQEQHQDLSRELDDDDIEQMTTDGLLAFGRKTAVDDPGVTVRECASVHEDVNAPMRSFESHGSA